MSMDDTGVVVFKTIHGSEVVLRREMLVAVEIAHGPDMISKVYAVGGSVWMVKRDVAQRLSDSMESGEWS